MSKRICIVCGTKYDYCPSCGNADNKPWKNVYDTEECVKVSEILMASRGKHATMSVDEAKKEMEKYPAVLEKAFKYDSLTANRIKELFGVKEEKKEEQATDAVDTVVEETPVVEAEVQPVKEKVEVQTEKVEPRKSEFKSGYKGNKNFKK